MERREFKILKRYGNHEPCKYCNEGWDRLILTPILIVIVMLVVNLY